MNTFAKKIPGFVGTLLLVACPALAQSFSIDTFTTAGGSDTVSGGGFSISGSVGQPDGNLELSGGDISLSGGFWSLVEVPDSLAIFDNTSGGQNGYESATTNVWLANKFCLGAQSYQLDSVTLILVSGDINGVSRVRYVRLQIYEDDPGSNKPSVSTGVIMDLSGTTNPIPMALSYTETPVSWVPDAPFVLAANTCYWAVLSTDVGDVGAIALFATPTGDAAAFGRGTSFDSGATWRPSDPGSNRKMLIRGTAVSTPPPPPELQITAFERIGNDLLLSFNTAAGKDYAIQSSAALSPDGWGTLPGLPSSGTGGIVQVTISNAVTQPQQFYRVKQLP